MLQTNYSMNHNIFTEAKCNVSTLEAARKYGLNLERKGAKYWSLCPYPFHSDKTPSHCIYPDGGFKCYGCGMAGQDSIRFVELLFNLKPLEAVKKLAEDFNIPIDVNQEIDREKLQSIKKANEELEHLTKLIKIRLESLYSNLCLLYRTFKEIREEADKSGIDKKDIAYQWILFHEGFFDRYSERMATGGTSKQVDYTLHIQDYYTTEVGELRKWIKYLTSSII